MRDIATQLGLSTATVSRALQDNPMIPERTRKRVKEAVAESRYVYRRGAAGLRTATTHAVGVVLNNISDPFFSSLLASLEAALAETGRTVFLCNTAESVDRQAEFIRRMTEYNADGLIVSPAVGSRLEHFASLPVGAPPVVFVSRTLFEGDFDHVVTDDREAARISTEHLLGLGHRRIAAVGSLENLSCFQERLIGSRDALENAGVPFGEPLVLPCVPTREGGYEHAASIGALSPRPTAATCYNDSTALGLYFGLMAAGLVPGRDVALVGNEDVAETRLVHPQLTVTTVSRDAMGQLAAELLVRRIKAPDAPQQRVVLPTKLIVRGTSNPPAAP